MTIGPRMSRLPRRHLPPIEPIAEPDGTDYVKIVRSLADAALVVVRSGDEIRFLAEFGRPSGIISVSAPAGDRKRWSLDYAIAGTDHVEHWMSGDEKSVREVFARFAGFAGRAVAGGEEPA